MPVALWDAAALLGAGILIGDGLVFWLLGAAADAQTGPGGDPAGCFGYFVAALTALAGVGLLLIVALLGRT